MLGPYGDRQVFSTKMIAKCGFNMDSTKKNAD
jgi:hypothetical protein